MSVYSYVRKDFPLSTFEQLKLIMEDECDAVFIEEARLNEDKELLRLLDTLTKHDVLIVANLQVFGKPLHGIFDIIRFLQDNEIKLISKLDQLDSSVSNDFYQLFNKISRSAKQCESRIAEERIQVARSEGKLIGRPAIEMETINKIQQMYYNNKIPLRTIADKCDVSLGTVHKYIKELELVDVEQRG